MKKRIISGVLGVIVLILVLFSNKLILNFAVAVISIIGLHELFSALGNISIVRNTKRNPLIWIAYIGSLVISFRSYISPNLFVTLVYALLSISFLIMLIDNKRIKFSELGAVLLSVIYVSFFFSHIIFTYSLPNGNILVWLIFLGAWATDTFAYFIGIGFGKNKLCPEISPKKTIEGSIGGFIGCGLAFTIFGYVITRCSSYEVNYLNLFLLGLACSIVSQLGDLVASVIKRQSKIKDFGYIIPGHGGILDRFDSIVFVSPLVYIFAKNFSIIFLQ